MNDKPEIHYSSFRPYGDAIHYSSFTPYGDAIQQTPQTNAMRTILAESSLATTTATFSLNSPFHFINTPAARASWTDPDAILVDSDIEEDPNTHGGKRKGKMSVKEGKRDTQLNVKDSLQCMWCAADDLLLGEFLLEKVHKGQDSDNGFKRRVWTAAATHMVENEPTSRVVSRGPQHAKLAMVM